MKDFALVPMRQIGPIKITSDELLGEVTVPLATFESPLWPSVARGARISRAIEGGIQVVVVNELMSRSMVVEAKSAKEAVMVQQQLLPKLLANKAIMPNCMISIFKLSPIYYISG
jgi:hydroxymethylglutaryl-CoA reductase (NADPH)